eukprot:5376305-Amphidinium_carterae.1
MTLPLHKIEVGGQTIKEVEHPNTHFPYNKNRTREASFFQEWVPSARHQHMEKAEVLTPEVEN